MRRGLVVCPGGPICAWWAFLGRWAWWELPQGRAGGFFLFSAAELGRASGLILAGPAARAAPGLAWGRPGASGPAIRGRGRRVRAGAAGGRVCRGVGRHFTPPVNFPGAYLYSPADFPGGYFYVFQIFPGAYTPRANFRIFLHFRNIPPFFAFFLRYSQK